MKLDFEQIRAVALGAEEIVQEEKGIHLHRFSSRQRELYRHTNEDFYRKSFATSGIKLQFLTDSQKLNLDVTVSSASSRSYFSIDVFVDGKMIGSIDNLTDDMPQDYTEVVLPLGDFSKSFDLGAGMKKVCVYLPWSACAVIRKMELDQGAQIVPVKPKHKLLAYGDSITQGYDAKHPSNKYITRLAEALDAEEYNKAIGGEEFYPPMADAEDGAAPDYIVVAYGTNDWSHSTREQLTERCTAFYAILSAKYPKANIIAMTPIWRADWQMEKPVGPFHDVEGIIRKAVKDLKNATVVRCFDMIPKDVNLFADLRLHPNDTGFDHYFQNLYQAASEAIADK